jgi:hypothetical protein
MVGNESGQNQAYEHLIIKRLSGAKRMTKYAPTFIDTPKIITSQNGKLIQMITKYQAKEQCHASWSKQGIPLSESQKVQVFHKRINANTFEYRVEVREPDSYTSGLYKALVSNEHGQMQIYLHFDMGSVQAMKKSGNAPTFNNVFPTEQFQQWLSEGPELFIEEKGSVTHWTWKSKMNPFNMKFEYNREFEVFDPYLKEKVKCIASKDNNEMKLLTYSSHGCWETRITAGNEYLVFKTWLQGLDCMPITYLFTRQSYRMHQH